MKKAILFVLTLAFGNKTPLDSAMRPLGIGEPSASHRAIADLLRKHGGKTAKELKAEGK